MPALNISNLHFASDLTDAEAKQLTQDHLSFIELEFSTACNRRCRFCGNKDMPWRQDKVNNQFMDEDLYLRILDDLAEIKYAGQIQFGRYNEPTWERDIFLKRISQARSECPRAFLYTHTNGDYLTRDYLDALRSAGLNHIACQTYLGNDDRYDEQKMLARQVQQLRKLGLKKTQDLVNVPGTRHFIMTDYPEMKITLDARNFDEIGTDRGGLVQINVGKVRTSPCFVPFTNMYVDYTGNTVPCCNIRSDREEHKQYVVSKLQDGTSVYRAFASLAGWRRSLLTYGPKSAPCDTCMYEQPAYSKKLEIHLANLAKQHKL